MTFCHAAMARISTSDKGSGIGETLPMYRRRLAVRFSLHGWRSRGGWLGALALALVVL
jgi:hypothetical protein